MDSVFAGIYFDSLFDWEFGTLHIIVSSHLLER